MSKYKNIKLIKNINDYLILSYERKESGVLVYIYIDKSLLSISDSLDIINDCINKKKSFLIYTQLNVGVYYVSIIKKLIRDLNNDNVIIKNELLNKIKGLNYAW